MTTATGGRPRRERTATESLLSITLVLEAIVVFFVALTVYGLDLLPAWAALGGGVTLLLLLLIDARLVRLPAGIGLGWVLQLALVLLGLVTPVMWFVGAGFAALWVFCFVKGRQLDRAKAEYLAAHPSAAAAPETRATYSQTPSEEPSAPNPSKETE